MSKLLRHALEDVSEHLEGAPKADDSQERTIVMKGPLAEVYMQALDVAYAKDDPVTGETALETQAIDAMIGKQIAQQLAQGNDSGAPATIIYGVSQSGISDEDIVDITRQLAGKEESTEFHLVIDATTPSGNSETAGAPQERLVELTTAMECIVTAYGGKVFHSLEEFAKNQK